MLALVIAHLADLLNLVKYTFPIEKITCESFITHFKFKAIFILN
jgi:hypothetical protein